jgi:hypothetical protein
MQVYKYRLNLDRLFHLPSTQYFPFQKPNRVLLDHRNETRQGQGHVCCVLRTKFYYENSISPRSYSPTDVL